MNRLGLVLEGGGMRGVYTAGVLDYFLEKNIAVDGVIGVSAGSCHGVSFLSKQYQRNLRVNLNYLDDPDYLSMRNFLKTGSPMNWILLIMMPLIGAKQNLSSYRQISKAVSRIIMSLKTCMQISNMCRRLPLCRY